MFWFPVGGAHFFCQRTFVEFFSWGGGSFSTLETILLYISSNVYRIDTQKKTLHPLNGYKVDFS